MSFKLIIIVGGMVNLYVMVIVVLIVVFSIICDELSLKIYLVMDMR